MALVKDIVARFRAETTDYLAKADALKSKNREAAMSIVQAAGSAEEALASLNIAKQKGALADFGIDRRNVSGIAGEIRAIARETKEAKGEVIDLEQALRKTGDRAGGLGDITDSFQLFARGDFLAGFEKWKKGFADLEETKGLGGAGVKAALIGTAMQIVGEMTAKATAEAVRLKGEYEAGKISGGQMTEQLLGQLPVLGNIWQTGRNIRELMGLENHELEKQAALFDRILTARQGILDIANGARDRNDQAADQTQSIIDNTAVVALQAQGKTSEAAALAAKNKLAADIKSFTDATNKALEADTKRLDDMMNKGAKEGEKGLAGQLRDAADAKRKAQETYDQSLSDPEMDTAAARESLNLASENYVRIQAAVNENLKQRAKLEGDAKAAIDARTDALKNQAGAEADKVKAEDEKRAKETAEKARQEIGKNIRDAVSGFVGKAENNPAVQWIKSQIEAVNKTWESMKADAAKFKENNKTDVEKFRDQLDNAQRLKNAGLISGNDMKKANTKSIQSLLEEEQAIQDASGKSVYSMPQVSEIRGGQTLFNSPEMDLSKKQLERLAEIKEELRLTREQNQNNGLDISVVK